MTAKRNVTDADREIGARLKMIRLKRRYATPQDFIDAHGEELGIKIVTYRNHERGDGVAGHIDNYARILKTPANFLRYGDGPEDEEGERTVRKENDNNIITLKSLDSTSVSPQSPSNRIPLSDLGAPVEPAHVSVPVVGSLPRNLPVMGLAAGGPGDADFRLNGQIDDYIRRPPALEHVKKAFAVYVVGESMVPRFDEGEPIFVNPSRPPRIGDYVLCELFPTADGEPGPAYVKRLVKKTSEVVELEQFNPPKILTIDANLVKSVYKIMSPADFFI